MKRRKKMTNSDKKVFGEDKLGKLVRLLDRYEKQIQLEQTDFDSDINIRLCSDGSGTLFAGNQIVCDFVTTDYLFKFLESGQLTRTLMSRG
jgi:hypothetical protein